MQSTQTFVLVSPSKTYTFKSFPQGFATHLPVAKLVIYPVGHSVHKAKAPFINEHLVHPVEIVLQATQVPAAF